MRCIYKLSGKEIPYPRVLYVSECGYELAIMEGYKHKGHTSSDGKSKFSTRTQDLQLPTGKCSKCGFDIEFQQDSVNAG